MWQTQRMCQMDGFEVYHLQFDLQASSPIDLPLQKGSALRGALYAALRRHYCAAAPEDDPTHSALCPVCRLLATESQQASRGRDVPRPLAVKPPLDGRRRYEPGEVFCFGVAVVGSSVGLFPYLALALPMMGREGVGRRLDENGGARGQFSLQAIAAYNPLTGARQTLMNAAREIVALPALPVTWAQAEQAAADLPAGEVTLDFLTPTRIVDGGQLVHRPHFRPLFQRLLEGLLSLAETFGGGRPDLDARALVDAAGAVRLVRDGTRWLDLHSGSRRLGRSTPIGGFVGKATYAGDLAPFLPWLLLGQSVHVGKSAVKGNGWYQIVARR
ncbi:MAG: hypothetical protein Kow00120_12510 [Anaerolineae bacterium]